MQIGIPKEYGTNITRVAATPKNIQQLIELGFDVVVEKEAGELAHFDDESFLKSGATIALAKEIWQAPIILKINAPTDPEIAYLKEGTTLISFIWPAQNPDLLKKLANKKITVIAMDAIPRISRAQSMDALSSMANIAGYRAVIEAAHEFGRFFTGQITAAGKIPPAKVLVIGAGVAGLAAIGAASALGAIVRAFDTRPEVKEQIQSMGATFLEVALEEESGSGDGYAKEMSKAFIEAEMALFAAEAKEVDIIVTTALIPGKPAPRLITKAMVDTMKPGSIVVDLAAATGGNCELTVADQVVVTSNHVKILGYTDLPSRLPTQSSQLYSANQVNLIKLLCPNKDGTLAIDFDDVVVRQATVIKSGEITWPAPPIKVSAAKEKSETAKPAKTAPPTRTSNKIRPYLLRALMLAAVLFVALTAPSSFLAHFTVFSLACIVGYYVIWNVTHALHTPLMSVTNAISGIIIIGALLQIAGHQSLTISLAFFATLIASINIFGGFAVTQRMLKMFQKR